MRVYYQAKRASVVELSHHRGTVVVTFSFLQEVSDSPFGDSG